MLLWCFVAVALEAEEWLSDMTARPRYAHLLCGLNVTDVMSPQSPYETLRLAGAT